MAYVPGYNHDIFVSYAHGDDRDWLNRLLDRLQPALKRSLGVEVSIWIDEDDLRASRNFKEDIPKSIESSAVFLFFPSNTYVRSSYCVEEECRTFQDTLAARRTRFDRPELKSQMFALRCPLLPVDNNEHWELFPGLTDIPFCDENGTYPMGNPQFEASFRRLTSELLDLLKRMRNHCTPVFLYPPSPVSGIEEQHAALVKELTDQGYRLLPDRKTNLAGQLRESGLAVFLLASVYEEQTAELSEIAAGREKPWVVWCSPGAERGDDPRQLGLSGYLESVESTEKTYLDSSTRIAKLKEEILALIGANKQAPSTDSGKPRVYLIYKARDRGEAGKAFAIAQFYKKDFHFDHPDDPSQHTVRLSGSAGVLLVWGTAEEEWCSQEFGAMIQTARKADAKGLCVFDPREAKTEVLSTIREHYGDLFIAEQYGKFDPAQMDVFFNLLRRRAAAGGQP